MGLSTPRAIIDILFHHMVYHLVIHHPLLYRCLSTPVNVHHMGLSTPVTNLIPICTGNHQTQPDQTHAYNSNAKEEAQEAPIDHTITGFRPHPGYIAEGHAFSGILVLNAPGASQYRPLSQPLHFMRGERPPIVFEKEKIEHMEERLCAIERGGSYGFVDMSELCLVPDVTIPPKFKVPDFDKYKF